MPCQHRRTFKEVCARQEANSITALEAKWFHASSLAEAYPAFRTVLHKITNAALTQAFAIWLAGVSDTINVPAPRSLLRLKPRTKHKYTYWPFSDFTEPGVEALVQKNVSTGEGVNQ